jgi:hypothetical protein
MGLLGSSPIPRSLVASRVSFQLRPLPSPGITRLLQYCGPLRHPKRPGLALTSCRLIPTAITAGASRVASGPLCLHAVANTPAGSMGTVRSSSPSTSAFPRFSAGQLLHHPFRGLHSVHYCYGLQTRQVAKSDPLHQRLQQLRYLHYCSDCYRVERTSSRAGFSPLWTSAFSRRTRKLG